MFTLQAQPRTIIGKKVKKLRQGGYLPAIVYGDGGESIAISIPTRDFERVFRDSGETTLIDLAVDSDHYNVMIKDVSHDPIDGKPVHIDFFRVPMDEEIEVEIPLEFIGESPAVKVGGVLVKVMHEVGVRAMPAQLPNHLDVDLTKLANLGDRISAQDISLPAGVTLTGDVEEVIVLIEEPAKEEEAQVAEAIDLSKIEVVGKGKEKEPVDGAEASEEKSA